MLDNFKEIFLHYDYWRPDVAWGGWYGSLTWYCILFDKYPSMLRNFNLTLVLQFFLSQKSCSLNTPAAYTVKPVLSCRLKVYKKKVLMDKCNLMKVESTAECSPWSILQYF